MLEAKNRQTLTEKDRQTYSDRATVRDKKQNSQSERRRVLQVELDTQFFSESPDVPSLTVGIPAVPVTAGSLRFA